MAAPSYTTDLTDITLAESTTGWSAYGGGASGLAVNPDSAMQGTNCVGKNITGAGTDKGQYFDNGSGITLGTGDHVWQWLFCTTPGLTDTRANKGASVLIGTGGTAYCQYHVEGSNTYGAAGRVGKCYAIDYTTRSSNTGSEPYRTVTGSPGASPQVFGGGLKTTAAVKGENSCVDAARYGLGGFMTAGELISAGDGSDNPCTFAGFNSTNDSISNRWGILTSVGGGYELQGTFAIGQNNSGTATLARFEDSDVSVAIVDTIHAASTFTSIIIDHASTVCNWTNIVLTALGTTNRGRVTVTSNDPEFNVTGGTWTGLGPTTLDSNSTVSGLTWRACDTITTGEGSVTDCLIDQSFATVAMVHSHTAMANLTGNTFISDGTGHAVNLGTVSSSTTINWDNSLSGYVAGATGDPVTTGTSGNEAILCNVAASQKLTINVASGASIPSVKNDGTGTVAVVAGQVTLTVTVVDVTDGDPIQDARVYVIAGSGGSMTPGDVIIDKVLTNASGVASDTRSYSGNQPITGRVRKGSGTPFYKEAPIAGTVSSASGLDLTVQMIPDE